MTGSSEILQHVLVIWYPQQFRNNNVPALHGSDSDINAMWLVYIAKQSLYPQKITIYAHEIDSLPCKTSGIITLKLLLHNELN